MLGKLLKHEWKMTWKVPSLLCFFVVLVTIIGLISYQFMGIDDIHDVGSAVVYTYMMISLFMFNILVISSAGIIILVYFSYRFYKTMFTSEGYLTNTLPVKPSELIISKLLCAVFWSIIVTILSLAGMVLMLLTTIDSIIISAEAGTIATFIEELNDEIPDIIGLFEHYTGVSFPIGVTFIVLLPLFGCFSSILLPYVCLSLGQLCKKHKVAASVGFYFSIFIVIQIATSIISLPFTLRNIFSFSAQTMKADAAVGPIFSAFPSYFISLLMSIVISIAAYCITRYIVARKLNLE